MSQRSNVGWIPIGHHLNLLWKPSHISLTFQIDDDEDYEGEIQLLVWCWRWWWYGRWKSIVGSLGNCRLFNGQCLSQRLWKLSHNWMKFEWISSSSWISWISPESLSPGPISGFWLMNRSFLSRISSVSPYCCHRLCVNWVGQLCPSYESQSI